MKIAIGLIFDMRRIKINETKIINIYKLEDICFGFNYTINGCHTLMPINSVLTDNILYLICDHNKNILKDAFNEEGYYCGTLDFETLEELLIKNNLSFDNLREHLFNIWGNSYYFLEKDTTLNSVKKEENIKLCDSFFNIKSENYHNDKINVNKNILSKYGTFLTDKEYLYNPAIGREQEIKRLEMALLGYDTNGLLIGDAGVGKTAIVEGLAYRIKKGLIHEKLKNIEIVSITSSSMIAGASHVGDKEKNLREILEALKNAKNIIMFNDEMHTLEGAGVGEKSNLDVANILKPYIERGEVKIIGATTKEEYNTVMTDNAFKSRFKRIDVNEPNNDMLVNILDGVIKGLEKHYDIKFAYDKNIKNNIFNILMELTAKQYREVNENNNPRLILSIIKDSFANALYNNRTIIDIEDIIFGINECDRIYKSVRERYSLELKKIDLNKIKKEEKNIKVLKFPNENFK